MLVNLIKLELKIMYILKNLRIDINLDLKFWEENGIQGLNVKGITVL